MVAAPGVFFEDLSYLRPQRVLMDVFQECQQVVVTIAEDCLVSPLKKMADGPIFPIEIRGICLIDALQYLGERNITGFHQQVDVVSHENVGVEMESVAVLVNLEGEEIFLVVGCVLEDLLPLVPAGYDMIERSGVFDAGLARHDARIAKEADNVNILILKSDPLRSHVAVNCSVSPSEILGSAGVTAIETSVAPGPSEPPPPPHERSNSTVKHSTVNLSPNDFTM